MYITANSPDLKDAKKFPPESFPLYCSFLFGKRYIHIADEIKALVQQLPKDSFRFRKSISSYGGVTVNLYFKDADSFRPVAHGLRDKELVIDSMLYEDKQVFPRDLIKMAQEAYQSQSRVLS